MNFSNFLKAGFTGLGANVAQEALTSNKNPSASSNPFALSFGSKFIIGLGLTIVASVVVTRLMK